MAKLFKGGVVMKYDLSQYIVSISPADPTLRSLFGTISIGGEGSYTESITLSNNGNLFTTAPFATGAWVHNKSLDKTGTCTMSLSQLSRQVAKLLKFCMIYYSGNYDGSTITVSDISGNRVATCSDCYPQKFPDQVFGESSANQSWVFTCGKIVYN